MKREWHSYSSFSNSPTLSFSEVFCVVHLFLRLCCDVAHWLHPVSCWEKHQEMLWLSTAWSEKGCAPPKSAEREREQSVLTLWNSVIVFMTHYVFAGAVWYIDVSFIALYRCLVCSSRAVHLHSGNSWHLLFWLGLERLSYMHQKMKNQDSGRHTIPFCDYLRHSREVRPKIANPSP